VVNDDQTAKLSALHTLEGVNTSIGQASTSIDDLLNSKLNKMSLEERSSGLHDLHGVSPLEKEDSEMIRTKIREMNLALAAATQDTIAYDKAVAMSREYVEGLKIKCLRAECYDSKGAADLLVRHFERKLMLFSEDKLTKEITQDDLDPDDLVTLRNGVFQILPQRDRSGRALIMYLRKGNCQYSNKSVLRVMHYMAMSVVQDEEIQRRGVVIVGFGFGEAKFVANRPLEYTRSWEAIPARVVALHSCRNSCNQITNLILCNIMKSRMMSRFRMHVGTPMECMYTLMTFGIPRDAIPATDCGVVDLAGHHAMLAVMKRREEVFREQLTNQNISKSLPLARHSHKALGDRAIVVLGGASTGDDTGSLEEQTLEINDGVTHLGGTILVPGPMDILMGRGRHPKSRPGALRMHHLVLQHRVAYDSAKSRLEKTAITKSVLLQLKALGCRFLHETKSGYYVETDDVAAREKISHGFRNQRLKAGGGGGGASVGSGSSGTRPGGEGIDTSNHRPRKKRDLAR